MKPQAKAAWILIITFVAGGAAGALVHRAVMRDRIRGLIQMREAGLLIPWRGPILDRLNEDQKGPVLKLFDEYGRKLAAIHERTREEIDAVFESLWKELETVLPAETLKTIKEGLPRWPPQPPGEGPGGPPRGPEGRPGGPGQPGDPRFGGPGRQGGPGGPEGPGGPGREAPPPPPAKPPDKKAPWNEPGLLDV